MNRRQRGYGLIIMLALLATFSMVYIGSALRSQNTKSDVRAQRVTFRALREAQTALIGYAAMEDNTPGTLPCPAPDVDGKSVGNCDNGTPLVINRIPWHRLGMTAPRDGEGQCLWYALSLSHRNLPGYTERGTDADTPPINPDTSGSLSLQRDTLVSQAVAVLMAPGIAVNDTQAAQRSLGMSGLNCSGGPLAAYFEASGSLDNADGNVTFVDAPTTATFNDRLRSIDQRQILKPVLRRTLQALAGTDMRTELLTRMTSMGTTDGTLTQLREDAGPPHDFDTKLLPTAPTATGAACPTAGISKHPVGWLCVNGWYEKITYSTVTNSLVLLLDSSDPAGYGCRMRLSTGDIVCGMSV